MRQPRDPRLDRILEHVVRSRQAFWTPDLANDPRLASPPVLNPSELSEARAVLVAPVRIRETLLGLLGVAGDTGRAFTDADVELVQALADQAALGIANAGGSTEKLVAMGRLASGLAHELRNPLQNVVCLTSELLERSAVASSSIPSSLTFPNT